jgi:hypothetical protein
MNPGGGTVFKLGMVFVFPRAGGFAGESWVAGGVGVRRLRFSAHSLFWISWCGNFVGKVGRDFGILMWPSSAV